jgi:hypothetical protein
MSADGKNVPVTRTVASLSDYARAVVRSWWAVGRGVPPKAAVAVLFAQYMIETGGRACWNWNIGNVKKADGDGFDYIMLRGVWEGVPQQEAIRLVSTGQATMDTSEAHKRAVAPRVPVLFQPPHRATWFRAYPDLTRAMEHHLQFLAKRRYAPAWPHVLAGDVSAFAQELKRRGYFTASAEAYTTGMLPHFDAFMRSGAFEKAVEEFGPGTEPTLPAPPDSGPESEPTTQSPRATLPWSGEVGDDIAQATLDDIAKRNGGG